MKIVTYNLHFGGHKKSGNHWQKVLDELSPDLFFAQESFFPSDYFPEDRSIPLGNSSLCELTASKWGSAIYSAKYHLEAVAIPDEFHGWLVGAKINSFSIGGVDAGNVMVFSVHAPSPGSYEKSVGKMLDFIESVADGCELILAGDFNITTAYRHKDEMLKNTNGELAILKRLRTSFGLVNAWQAIHPNGDLPQTLRWSGDQGQPYHCDGIFIPCSWIRYIESCEVDAARFGDMSDHYPIVVNLIA